MKNYKDKIGSKKIKMKSAKEEDEIKVIFNKGDEN